MFCHTQSHSFYRYHHHGAAVHVDVSPDKRPCDIVAEAVLHPSATIYTCDSVRLDLCLRARIPVGTCDHTCVQRSSSLFLGPRRSQVEGGVEPAIIKMDVCRGYEGSVELWMTADFNNLCFVESICITGAKIVEDYSTAFSTCISLVQSTKTSLAKFWAAIAGHIAHNKLDVKASRLSWQSCPSALKLIPHVHTPLILFVLSSSGVVLLPICCAHKSKSTFRNSHAAWWLQLDGARWPRHVSILLTELVYEHTSCSHVCSNIGICSFLQKSHSESCPVVAGICPDVLLPLQGLQLSCAQEPAFWWAYAMPDSGSRKVSLQLKSTDDSERFKQALSCPLGECHDQ